MAGQYGANRGESDMNVNKPETFGEADHEHGYEWQQAREAERMERQQGQGTDAPPGYDVSAATSESTFHSCLHAWKKLLKR